MAILYPFCSRPYFLMLLAYSDQYFFLRCNLRRKNINWRQAKPATTNKATPIIALPLNNRPNNAAPKTPIKIMLASMAYD